MRSTRRWPSGWWACSGAATALRAARAWAAPRRSLRGGAGGVVAAAAGVLPARRRARPSGGGVAAAELDHPRRADAGPLPGVPVGAVPAEARRSWATCSRPAGRSRQIYLVRGWASFGWYTWSFPKLGVQRDRPGDGSSSALLASSRRCASASRAWRRFFEVAVIALFPYACWSRSRRPSSRPTVGARWWPNRAATSSPR